MSNTIIKTVLSSGPRSALIHLYLESDGNEGELTNYVIVDPTIYDNTLSDAEFQPGTKLTIIQTWHSFGWFDALLSFDDLVPSPSWLLVRDASNQHADFRYFGGIANRLTPPKTEKSTDRTGRILLSTKDFAPLGSVGTLILELRKSKV